MSARRSSSSREITWANRSRRGSRVSRKKGTTKGLSPHLIVLIAVYFLLSAAVGTVAATIMHNRSQTVALAQPPKFVAPQAKYLVLMVLDGARPDYFGLTNLPHVDSLRLAGTQYSNAMDGILESETPTGHTTISTGSTPARNGILGFEWAQNDNDYSIFSPQVVQSGAMEHIMEATSVPTIAGLFKAKYPGARVVALSGHKYYAADPLGGPAADAIMYYQGDPKGRYVPVAIPGHTPPAGVLTDPALIYPTIHLAPGVEDNLATNLALKTFSEMHQRVTLINYPEFDWPLGHVDGGNTDPKDVITLMQGFDHDLGEIEDAYRKAGILDKTLFVITADHGMGAVTRFVPEDIVTNAVAKAGTTAPAISYSTGTYVWLADHSKAQAVAQNIAAAKDPGIESTYYLSTINGQQVYERAGGQLVSNEVDVVHKYLLATLMNGHQPDVVVFAHAGETFADPKTGWKGDHGGAGWESQHIPLILAGPGIRAGIVNGQPAQLEDIAPTVLADLGVRPTGMQGHVLTDALIAPQKADVQSRQREIDLLTPMVDALVAQYDYEQSH